MVIIFDAPDTMIRRKVKLTKAVFLWASNRIVFDIIAFFTDPKIIIFLWPGKIFNLLGDFIFIEITLLLNFLSIC